MIVGVPKEIKVREYRVGMTPGGVKKLVDRGHKVLVETKAGIGSGLSDDEYHAAGAEIVKDIQTIYGRADMVVKVKEPIEPEYDLIRENQIIYTYLHLAADETLTHKLLERKCIAIAYETIQLPDGSLPLLKPMSEVAGRMATQVGANTLEKENGGKGLLLGGVPGVRQGRVVVLGGGVVGLNATKMAVGLGAQVSVLDVNLSTLNYLDDIFHGRVQTVYSDSESIRRYVAEADLLIGAVLIAGAKAPNLVNREMLRSMEDGSVLVDVAVDQGGCIETTKPTTHDDPTFVVDGVVHYCVANMPGAVAHTSTFALTNTTIAYAAMLADLGAEAAARKDRALALGFNAYKGKITCLAVAEAFSLECSDLGQLLGK
ncbi:MAG: alanine dehydrogenase [Deltaproteobacteria bacterium]|nr:alanine dehydrogenase [Deltaproteobacteria bacterium]